MKAFSLFALCWVVAAMLPASANDDLFADRYSYDMGKAVLDTNDQKARNLFIEGVGGAVFGVSGDFVSPMNRRIPAETFGGPHPMDTERPKTKVEKLSYDDVFNTAAEYGVRFGKQMGDSAVYFRVTHTAANGGERLLGEVGDSALFGDFEDYSDWGILFGLQKEFAQPGRIHPYAGFEAGLKFVSGLNVDLSAQGSPFSYQDVAFFDDSVVFALGITLGVAFDITDAFRIGVESGLRYQTEMDEDDTGLEPLGLEYINGGDGWTTVPLYLTGRIYF